MFTCGGIFRIPVSAGALPAHAESDRSLQREMLHLQNEMTFAEIKKPVIFHLTKLQ